MNRSSMLSRFLFLGGFRVSGDPSDEAGMVENFGDGELRETFQFHLQYLKTSSYGYCPKWRQMAISPSKPQTSSRSFTRALALA
ncbi:hypothetical protein HID58_084233 [Brassica napus]|uniref:Uncharacterized protein n=1 Tax=Brassica napus TaxID=3708 RepID=A0ABQ7XL45_BRANA|nr:hypothetical protein HID58_084233 [Brassica napus]